MQRIRRLQQRIRRLRKRVFRAGKLVCLWISLLPVVLKTRPGSRAHFSFQRSRIILALVRE